MYQRTLKKIALYLLEKVSVRNKYKSNKSFEYLIAYTETFAVFSIILMEGKRTPDIIKKFIEFTSIYFPTVKVIKIMKDLVAEGSIDQDYKDWMTKVTMMRDKTAKKNFNTFVQNNSWMKAILTYSKQVYDREGENILKGKLRKTVEKVLISWVKIANQS